MRIDLTEAFGREGQEFAYECSLEAERIMHCGEDFPVKEKTPFILSVSCEKEQKVKISGKTKVTLLLSCDRCLRETPVTISLNFHRAIDFASLSEHQEEALEISSFVEENMLDVDAFIANELFFAWPTKTLCSESCKGICKKCGKNLNEGDCGCEQTELDPRMAAIRDIFYENYKEEV